MQDAKKAELAAAKTALQLAAKQVQTTQSSISQLIKQNNSQRFLTEKQELFTPSQNQTESETYSSKSSP